MTKLDQLLSEIEGRVKDATPGPWYLAYQTPFGAGGAVCSPRNIHARTKDWEKVEVAKQPHMTKQNKDEMWANGRLIAHAPTDIARLVNALKIAQENLEYIASVRNKDCWIDGCTCPFDNAVFAIAKIEAALKGKDGI